MQVYQQLDIVIVPPACNFIKNEAPAQVYPCKFCEFFSACNFIKNATTAPVFSREF